MYKHFDGVLTDLGHLERLNTIYTNLLFWRVS